MCRRRRGPPGRVLTPSVQRATLVVYEAGSALEVSPVPPIGAALPPVVARVASRSEVHVGESVPVPHPLPPVPVLVTYPGPVCEFTAVIGEVRRAEGGSAAGVEAEAPGAHPHHPVAVAASIAQVAAPDVSEADSDDACLPAVSPPAVAVVGAP